MVKTAAPWNRAARRAAVIAALLLGGWVAAAWALDLHGRGRTAADRWDAIVVAGANVRGDGTPKGSLERRVRRAVELYRAGHAPRLVLTGGQRGQRPAEAVVAAELARALGVAESALTIEARSRSTRENAELTRELIGAGRVLVVTDAYHVLRTELVFERSFAEVRVVGVTYAWYPQLRLAMREVLALGWFFVSSPFA